VKKIEKYRCEVCGTEYADRKVAEECEKGHKTVEKIQSARYQPITLNRKGYPVSISVLMSDGQAITYGRGVKA